MRTALGLLAVVGLLSLGGMVLFAFQKGDAPQFKNVSPEEFQKTVKEKPGLLLDVRTPKEFASGRIAGATNIDFFGEHFKEEIAKLDKSKPVYVYCRSGGRSGKTMAQMESMGFTTVLNLDGGVLGWTKKGLPLEKPE